MLLLATQPDGLAPVCWRQAISAAASRLLWYGSGPSQMRRWSCTTCLPFFVVPNCLTSHLPLPAQLMRSPSLTILLAEVTSFQLSLHHSRTYEHTIPHPCSCQCDAGPHKQGVGISFSESSWKLQTSSQDLCAPDNTYCPSTEVMLPVAHKLRCGHFQLAILPHSGLVAHLTSPFLIMSVILERDILKPALAMASSLREASTDLMS